MLPTLEALTCIVLFLGSATIYTEVHVTCAHNLFLVWFQDIHAEAVKKRRRTTKKPYSRSIVGASLDVIQKKRAEKPEVRDAAREAALR